MFAFLTHWDILFVYLEQTRPEMNTQLTKRRSHQMEHECWRSGKPPQQRDKEPRGSHEQCGSCVGYTKINQLAWWNSWRVDGELPANGHSLYWLILTHRHSEDSSSTLNPDPPMTKHFPTWHHMHLYSYWTLLLVITNLSHGTRWNPMEHLIIAPVLFICHSH